MISYSYETFTKRIKNTSHFIELEFDKLEGICYKFLKGRTIPIAACAAGQFTSELGGWDLSPLSLDYNGGIPFWFFLKFSACSKISL